MKWIIGSITACALLIGAGVAVHRQQTEHEKFIHTVWHAASYQNRAEADSISVWARHYMSGNGCQYRCLFVRLPGSDRPIVLTSRTVNMWGYSQYGWEPWSDTSDEVLAILQAYVANLDEKTAKLVTGHMRFEKL